MRTLPGILLKMKTGSCFDPDARYSGAKLSEKSLIPGKDAKLGSIKFDWWLVNVAHGATGRVRQ